MNDVIYVINLNLLIILLYKLQMKKILDYIKKIFNIVKLKLLKSTAFKIILGGVLSLIFFLYKNKTKVRFQRVKLNQFIDSLNKNQISEVTIKGLHKILFKSGNNNYITNAAILPVPQLYAMLKDKNIPYNCINQSQGSYILLILWGILSYALYNYIYHLLYQKQNFSPNNLKDRTLITFKDVYGLQKPKEALSQTVDYLKNPQKYIKIGCRLRKGIIFYGRPGTGKTLLAKATAGETGSQFISCSASQFCEMYVGVGAKRIRQLFQKARSYKSAIIFIDQIDAIGKRKNQIDSADSERNSTLNQLLTEMDGFNTHGNIVVIAATNRLQMIDEALLRSGRFDLKINVPLPNKNERQGILRLHLSKKSNQISPDMIQLISETSEGFSGADIQNLTNESAYVALKKAYNSDKITDQDLYQSFTETIKSRPKYF